MFWTVEKDYSRTLIEDMVVLANVGMHPWEKHPERPTRLIVNVEMFSNIGKKKDSYIENFVNYDLIRDHINTWQNRPHTLLLETLVEEVIQKCFEIQSVQACKVSIKKPDIFSEAKAVGVEMYRIKN